MVEITLIPAFRDNYIWLLQPPTGGAIVVDPGEAAPVLDHLAASGRHLQAILITHHHADHQGGVSELLSRWAVPVYGPGDEPLTDCSHPLAGGETLLLGGLSIEVLAVPGHTRAHLAYRVGNHLFCGDTLFGAGCGRLFEGTPAQMLASLDRLAALPDETQVFCAHEYTALNLPFALAVEPENPALQRRAMAVAARREAGLPTVPLNLGEEKATNPFLRCREAGVEAVACQQGAVTGDPVSVFAALRAWRNVF